MFTLEVTLGNILTVAAIISGWAMFIFGLKGKLDLVAQSLSVIDKRLNNVEATITALNQTTIELARQEVRLDTLSQRILELEHNK